MIYYVTKLGNDWERCNQVAWAAILNLLQRLGVISSSRFEQEMKNSMFTYLRNCLLPKIIQG